MVVVPPKLSVGATLALAIPFAPPMPAVIVVVSVMLRTNVQPPVSELPKDL